MVQRSVPAQVKPEGDSFADPYLRWANYYKDKAETLILRDRKNVRAAIKAQGRGYTVELRARYLAIVDELHSRKRGGGNRGNMWEEGSRDFTEVRRYR